MCPRHSGPPKLVVGALLLIALAPGAALAQQCRGLNDLARSPVRLAGSIAAYSYAMAGRLEVTVGSRVFGALSGGATHDSELDAVTTDIGLTAGYQFVLGSSRRTFVCPLAGYDVSVGPKVFLNQNVDQEFSTRRVGLALGVLAVSTADLRVIPSGGLTLARVTFKEDNRAAEFPWEWSITDQYWLIDLGVGFVLSDAVTLRPGLSVPLSVVPWSRIGYNTIPFGREERELSLNFAVAVDPWWRRR